MAGNGEHEGRPARSYRGMTIAKTYKDILAEVLEIAGGFTLEIDRAQYDFVEYVIGDALELSDCVRLFQGHMLRKNRRDYCAHMANSDCARPSKAAMDDLYDRACDAELGMREEGMLDCPHCTPGEPHDGQ